LTERRRFKRVTVTGELAGNVIYKADIVVQNISLGGICFLTEKRLNPGSKCYIELRKDDRCGFKLTGTVVRATLKKTQKVDDDFKPLYEIAVEFSPLNKSQQEELQRLISQFSQWND